MTNLPASLEDCTPKASSLPASQGLRQQRRRRKDRPGRQQLLCRSELSSRLLQHKGKVVVIDNYDSFTYNLSQYLGSLGCEHIVLTNDELTVAELRELDPRGILLSPGPGRPDDSGISLKVVSELGPHYPIFGVCMGHQCIGQAFGGRVVRAPSGVMHGKSSPVYHKSQGMLHRLSNPFQAARYHSLVIDRDHCPEELEVTAWTQDGTIMAVQHREFHNIQGVQFHPESIITDNGMRDSVIWPCGTNPIENQEAGSLLGPVRASVEKIVSRGQCVYHPHSCLPLGRHLASICLATTSMMCILQDSFLCLFARNLLV